MRAVLQASFVTPESTSDADLRIATGKALTFYEADGTTPITTPIYAAATGSTLATLTTDANGEFVGYSNVPKPVQVAVAGRTPKYLLNFAADRLGVVYVTDWGATGDGTTNDMAAIQAALAALCTSGGGILRFPEGRYLVGGAGAVTEILLATASVIFEGEGFVSKLVVDSATPDTCDIIRFHPSGNEAPFSGVRDLTITHQSGAGATVAYGRHAINIDITESGKFCREFFLERLWIDGFSGRAVELTNPLPNTNGFFTSGIRDNWMMGGIRLLNVGDTIIIQGNTLLGANVGIEASQVSGATELHIVENNITAAGGGIWLKSGILPVIRGNIVEISAALVGGSGNSALIDIDGSASTVTGATIADNVVTVANSALTIDCVRLDDVSHAAVKHNVFSSATGRVAILVTASAVTPDIGPNSDIGSGTMVRGTTVMPFGGSTIASASTIAPPVGGGTCFFVSGTTQINNITARENGDVLVLFPTGAWNFGSGGNIGPINTSAMTVVVPVMLIYSTALVKWLELPGR